MHLCAANADVHTVIQPGVLPLEKPATNVEDRFTLHESADQERGLEENQIPEHLVLARSRSRHVLSRVRTLLK